MLGAFVKPNDFCNWLRGHYDMGGSGKAWTPEQADMVSRHLELVFQAGPLAVGQGPQAQFCRWLAGTLEALADAAPGEGVAAPRAAAISTRLDAALKAGPEDGAKEDVPPRPPFGAIAKC